MPTIIALDVSMSMTRNFSENETFNDLAVKGIHDFLKYLSSNSRLEFVSLVTYSTQSEVLVSFTRDYKQIETALKSVEHCDKTNMDGLLATVSNLLATNWGTQSSCQVLVFTDCGIGFGATSIKKIISNLKTLPEPKQETLYAWLKYLNSSKLSFICIGNENDSYFQQAVLLYENYLEVSDQQGCCFKFKSTKEENDADKKIEDKNPKSQMSELIERMCEMNFKPFEALLKCGEYFRLQSPILIWPQPTSFKSQDKFGRNQVQNIQRRLDICGFLNLSDIGSPASVSRHLIVPKLLEKGKGPKSDGNEFEKVETEIRNFHSTKPEDDDKPSTNHDSVKESICVLLHGALKVENMAALVVLNENWYGFLYSYADSKKKSSLMLNILPPGNNVVPWLGDFRCLGILDETIAAGESFNFPVKSEKRSYSQNCVVWIKSYGLQSDIQKLLRHSKKLPEKTLQFYKELNRIRRAALSLGFVELLETLANIFEREALYLSHSSSSSPDCAIQLKHSAMEIRKMSNMDLKVVIVAAPTKYNQL